MFGSKKRYFGLRGARLNIAIAVVAGIDFLLFGYDQGVIGGLLILPSFNAVFPEIDTTTAPPSEATHVSTLQGAAVGSYTLGCFSGAIATAWVGDVLGRRRTIFMGSAIMIAGGILQASSFSLAQLVVARIITGIGNGFNTSTGPTWQSETSKSHRRGQMVMIEGAMITGGVCLSYWVDFGFSFLHSSASWRTPIALQCLFAALILLGVLELPESPRWLILKGYDDEALSVLAALHDLPPDDHFIRAEFAEIKDSVLQTKGAGIRDVFTMGEDRHFHRAVLGYVNQMFQQISGINVITFYAATIYQNELGMSSLMARVLAAANGTEYFAASWISVFIIERVGRRRLMIFGAIGMALSMAVSAVTNKVSTKGAGIVAAACLFIFNTFFAIGWLGMTWLVPAEIVPLRIRAPATALSTSANWIWNFMVVMITPIAFSSIGYKTYIIFSVINAFIVPVVYLFYPETRLRSLEEMDTIFRKAAPGWRGWLDVVRVARAEPHRYDKHGMPLIDYEATAEHAQAMRHVRGSAVGGEVEEVEEKRVVEGVERV